MGKVLGIIAEYNPFHNGHLYHLEQAKKLTGSSYTVAVISGNFTLGARHHDEHVRIVPKPPATWQYSIN